LQEKLKSMGHEVEFIDYRPDYLILPYNIFLIDRFFSKKLINSLKYTIKEILILSIRIKRHQVFTKFISSKLNLSKQYFNKSAHQVQDYDAYVFGSDQIWNPKITNGFDPIYWGFFETKNNAPKISYAASMEALKLDEKSGFYCKKSLSNFASLSVREKPLQNILQQLTNKEIKTVLDPTLLICKEVWDQIQIKPNNSQKYVLVYQVRENKDTMRIANDVARQIGGIVIQLTGCPNFRQAEKCYQSASPEEFIGWIKYADCIVTTSYHGMAFSVIYNKPFYSVSLNDGGDSRTESLLSMLQLQDRIISNKDTPSFSKIDYRKTNELLKSLKDDSESYLNKSLV